MPNDTLNIPVEENKDTPQEHIDEMLNRVNQENGEVTDNPESSTGLEDYTDDNGMLFGKFKTPADLAKAYGELEKKLGRKPETTQNDEAPAGTTSEGGASDTLAGIARTFIENDNEMTPEIKETLSKLGVSEDDFNGYVEYITTQAEQATNRIIESIGGTDNFNAMQEWAANNLNDAEKQAYNDAVNGTVEAAALAVRGLYDRFAKESKRDPDPMRGTDNSNGMTNVGFKSRAEMTAAIRDPRYKKDEAYRKEVERKIANSKFF